jgi:hypothetical protein
MAAATPYRIGADASCIDGVCGEVSRVVVDPVARAVTHLVVEPKYGQGLSRLVPLDLVDAMTGKVRLRCTMAEFSKLSHAEETEVLPGLGGYAGYGPGQVLTWLHYVMVRRSGTSEGGGRLLKAVTYDTVPLGEVAVRHGDHVHATDGDIGQVQGLVIDPGSRHVTHVLLQEGHMWGRKQVAIPIGSVSRLDAGIQLNITKQQVEDLPPVDLDRPDE